MFSINFFCCLQDTWPYVKMHMDCILQEAFVNMFHEHPHIKDMFYSKEVQDQNTLAVNDDNEASDEGEHASKQKRKYGKFVFQTFFYEG